MTDALRCPMHGMKFCPACATVELAYVRFEELLAAEIALDAARQRADAAEEQLRCVPFTNEELFDAIRQHEDSECDGGCLSAGAGREVLRLRGALDAHLEGETNG